MSSKFIPPDRTGTKARPRQPQRLSEWLQEGDAKVTRSELWWMVGYVEANRIGWIGRKWRDLTRWWKQRHAPQLPPSNPLAATNGHQAHAPARRRFDAMGNPIDAS